MYREKSAIFKQKDCRRAKVSMKGSTDLANYIGECKKRPGCNSGNTGVLEIDVSLGKKIENGYKT